MSRRPVPREHGTNKGYGQHLENDEKACDECRLAHNAYIQAYRRTRKAERVDASNRYNAARMRALTRLGQAHPQEYGALLRQELLRDVSPANT